MTTRFDILGRFLTRDGAQRPRLALITNPPTAIERVELEGSTGVDARIESDLREAARYSDLIAIGRAVRDKEDASLSLRATELGFGILYVVDHRTTEARLASIVEYARAGVTGILVYAGGPQLGEPEIARQVEERFTDFAKRIRWPLAVLASGPLARYGVALRGIARNTDMSGLVLRPDELEGSSPLPDLSVIARLLSARVEDRPAMLALEDVQASKRATALALGCGYGIVIAPKAAAPSLAPMFDAYPETLSEPLLEPAAVFLFDEREGNPVGEDATQGALVLLRRALGRDPRLCFQDRPDLPNAEIVWVPAHGPLSAAAWTRLQCLAREGAHVVISGLRLADEVQSRRLGQLGVDPDSLPRTIACGSGAFWFVDERFEFRPSSDDAQAFVREVAAESGVEVRDTSDVFRAGRRCVEYVEGWMYASSEPPGVSWKPR